jgi:hypothetical protein
LFPMENHINQKQEAVIHLHQMTFSGRACSQKNLQAHA